MESSTAVVRVVTYASKSGSYGGPFDTALRQSEIVASAGTAVTLIAGTTDSERPSHDGRATAQFIRVRRVVPLGGFVGLFSIAFVRALARAYRSATVVHISIARELIPVWALIFAVVSRKRVILQPHGMLTSGTSALHRLVDFVLRPLVARADRIICLTNVEAHDIRRWLGKRVPPITVMGNPAPLDLPVPFDSFDSCEALFLARLHPRKRVDIFANAGEIAAQQGWVETYTIVGPDEGELERLQLGQDGRRGTLVYEGAIAGSEVAERVNRAAVFVLPSWKEPWGNVLITALTLGKPVVVTVSAALAPSILKYNAGVVVEDGDAGALALAVHRILSDEETHAEFAAGSRHFAKDMLGRDRQLTGLLDVYDIH